MGLWLTRTIQNRGVTPAKARVQKELDSRLRGNDEQGAIVTKAAPIHSHTFCGSILYTEATDGGARTSGGNHSGR